MVVLIASALAAILVSGFCSVLEACLLSVTPSQVAQLSGRHPRAGKSWQGFKRDVSKPMAAILLVNTAAATIGATVAGAQFKAIFGDRLLPFSSVVFTLLILQFGEILPKSLGVRYNVSIASWVAPVLSFMINVFAPVTFLAYKITHLFIKPVRINPEQSALHEISALAGFARLADLIGSHQERIIQGASRLSKMTLDKILIPVEQVTFLTTDQNLNQAILAAHIDPHTRFPICAGSDRNRVLGYVNFKEMIYHARTNPADQSLQGIIRPVHFASPDQSAADLLQVFVEQHVHMALVRSADGVTLGLVTLEDIVEELVGELEDEFDKLPRMYHTLSGGTIMVGGGYPIKDLARDLGIELEQATGPMSSWLIKRMGRVPRPGEVHQEQGARFTVRRTRRGKVFEVTVSPPGSAAPATLESL